MHVSLQKEIFEHVPHFFLGKFDVIELVPLLPEQLVSFYEELFGNAIPFSREALQSLAVLSRGVFRRFKKYIRMCLDSLYGSTSSTSSSTSSIYMPIEEISNTITAGQISKDMTPELSHLFPKSKQKRQETVILLLLLAEKGSVEQQEIQKRLYGEDDAAKMNCSRLLSTLEDHGVVKREFIGNKKTKIVSLR